MNSVKVEFAWSEGSFSILCPIIVSILETQLFSIKPC